MANKPQNLEERVENLEQRVTALENQPGKTPNPNNRLEQLADGIGLSSRDLGEIFWEERNAPKQVVTIENLTSFHRWQEADTLAVYLGG